MTPTGKRKSWVEETLYRQGKAEAWGHIPAILERMIKGDKEPEAPKTGYGRV